LHRPDLGGESAARTAGDDDRREQNAQFAADRDAHRLDAKGFRAEHAQLLHALVGQYDADQEAQDADDRERANPDLEHLLHDGVDAEPTRLEDRMDERHQNFTEELAQVHGMQRRVRPAMSDPLQRVFEPAGRLLGLRLEHIGLNQLEQVGMGALLRRHLGVGAAAGERENLERAGGVETLDLACVDLGRSAGAAGVARPPRALGQPPHMTNAENGPRAARLQHGLAGALGVAESGFGVCHRSD